MPKNFPLPKLTAGSRARRIYLLLPWVFSAMTAVNAAAAGAAASVDPALPAYTDPAVDIAGDLVCDGADTMQDLMDAWAKTFHSLHPAATIHVGHASKFSADGFTAMLAGKADIVTFVREPFKSEIAAYTKKFGHQFLIVNVAGGSYATKGGTHAIGIYVNAANPITQLTLSQLDAIFSKTLRRGASEAVTTWGQLGLGGDWKNRPIHLYGMLRQRETGNPPGIVNYVGQRLLMGGEWRDDLREQTDKPGESALQAIVNRVAEDPAGIGYSGFAFGAPGVKTIALAEASPGLFYPGQPADVASRNYPLSRQIYLGLTVAPDRPLAPLAREFLRFVLSREGQQAIAEDHMHFIPLNAEQAAAARAQYR
ncbi:phosphate transport system substrate-binding protein [Collimonas sp. OK307]|uniref:PstS family phosphate ABC transporter substrate-binding protein n=1 Tax=Collimonas sp. OK307 TaxID=1801620 RepID=UPI0008E00C7E|nr:substrate-binding domain-containing protein [Collimonas sp. OK307]SFH67974.1 phosphate transport system substrate-binding protein [Collimonas sp. OK307]